MKNIMNKWLTLPYMTKTLLLLSTRTSKFWQRHKQFQLLVGFRKKPSAILLNANNKGYCRVTLDKDSKSFFLGNLSKCQDDINRSNIWRIICDNMKMGLITGTEVIECFNKHIVGETEEYTLPVILAAIQWILLYKVNRNDESLDVVNFLYQTFL